MKVNGKLIEIQETQQVSDTFKKRGFVIEYAENPQYPEYVSFELIQDRCDLLDGFQQDQNVEVSFNLKGRKWVNPEGVTKYFNTLQAWRIEATPQQSGSVPRKDGEMLGNEASDLPF